MRTPFLQLTALAFFLFFAQGCASSSHIQSQKPTTNHFADGDLVEWVDKLESHESDRIRIGVMNDADFVYIAFNTSDRALIQSIMTAGLSFWFNGQGEKDREWGLKYPLGIRDVREPGSTRQDRDFQTQTPDVRNDLLDKTTAEYDVYFEEDKPFRKRIGEDRAFKAGASYDFGALSVELILPRGAIGSSDMAVATADGQTFGMGIITPDFAGGRGQQGGAGAGAGGRGGARGGRGGGRGGGGGRARAVAFLPIDLWFSVEFPGAIE